ncbi:restriction endonuclease subunit M [Salmonella enterica subsp. enterica serovar Abony]|uniref:site-specific DNA-methyltransferase (adenine-specific) n=3 Tax=Salmonella enterica TaxID=28901 RepID=A0A747EPT2_SALER|nr:N-6 DNA methylase [Salmonella enterica]EAA4370185.1 restriction endonuclease subunit M [Salmonella enterica subsp. enterica serovar Abony]EBW3290508.1 restriction endonuclease subunit M [Salmonella enterica subsp. enterica serovar Bijlmer]EBX9173275.1 restriction endonuclease subunit M [Salmonella enterica subsp. enterica serovar Kandla]ECD6355533.1 restriction endonuclease subunit M [Salmonella enterica subsp. enterica serovar Othmarschen]ECK9468246.1 methyltransferase [Salmonella enterica
MNDSLFEDLLTIIKKKSAIRNTEQAVELISLFIFLHYIKLYLHENDELFLDIKNISSNNTNNIKVYYQQLYQHFIFSKDIKNINHDMHEQIISKIGYIIDNVNNSEIIKYLDHSLSNIYSLKEFYQYSNSYQSLILRMVNESGRSGEYVTPSALVQIMVEMLSPTDGKSIYDPACGTSGLLIESAKYIKRNSKNKNPNYSIIGNDTSSFACLISIVNLLINKESNFEIILKDSLEKNKLNEKHDFVLTNPPFGQHNRLDNIHIDTCYKGPNLDYYFLEHVIDSLKVDGKAAIILPERFLHDLNKECIALKDKLFLRYNLECILSIPSGALLPYTAVKLCILFISNSGPTDKIYFYELNKGEKYSRSNTIKKDDFIVFLQLAKKRKITEHSWFIDIRDTTIPYNLLIKDKEKNSYNLFYESLSNIEETISNNEQLLSELSLLREKIASLETTVKMYSHKNTFEKIKIGNIAKINSGKLLQKNKLLSEGPIPVYGGNGIIGYNDEAMEYGENIVIGKVGALCGNVRYVQGDIWVTNNSLILKNKSPNKILTPYLAKLLSTLNLRKLAVGTAQQYLTTTQIKDVEVSLPPLTTQHTLNMWLDELDGTLEKYNKLIEKIKKDKQELKESLYKGLLIQ